jgi:hypothetical protein
MSDVAVFGFQRSIYVNVGRLILTKKEIDFHFHDTGNEGKNQRPRASRVHAWKPECALASVVRFRASLPPRDPVPHAREGAVSHRPLA